MSITFSSCSNKTVGQIYSTSSFLLRRDQIFPWLGTLRYHSPERNPHPSRAVSPAPHQLGSVLPALGYSAGQLEELRLSIDQVPCDAVVLGTPANLGVLVKIAKLVARVRFVAEDISHLTLQATPSKSEWDRSCISSSCTGFPPAAVRPARRRSFTGSLSDLKGIGCKMT